MALELDSRAGATLSAVFLVVHVLLEDLMNRNGHMSVLWNEPGTDIMVTQVVQWKIDQRRCKS